MTKSISSYSEEQRPAVIKRRLAGRDRGSGYFAARSAAEAMGIPVPADKKFGGSREPRGDREDRPKKKFPARPKASIKNHMRVKS